MRLAVEAKFVDFVLKDNVAIVKKKPIWVTTGCWLRVRRIGWKSDFMLRGGIRLLPVDKIVVDEKEYHVVAERKLRYGMIMVADKMMSTRFEHPLVIRKGYFVFEVKGEEARLVDAEPTHVMTVFEHTAYYRRAEIRISGDNVNVMYSDWVSCRQHSIALMVAFVPVGSQFTVCFNTSANKYRCREMIATVPPTVKREFFA